MKTIWRITLVMICLAIFSQASYSQSGEDLFEKESERIMAQANAKKISRTMAMKEILAAAKTYIPNDKITKDFLESQVDYSEQLDKKKISEKEWMTLKNARVERYEAAIIDREESKARAQRQADLENDRMRQAQAAAAQQQRNTAATAYLLNGVGNAANTSFGQSLTPPVKVCNYYGGTRYCY